MVAATPLPPELPQLTERESELLAHFLILRYDMVELAERNKLLPQQLLAFAHSPAVNAHLAAFKSFAETSFTLRLLEARTKALDILEKVATTSENPIEQRRAASTIFRGTGLQRDRSGSSGASRSPSSPAGGGAAALSGGGGSVSTSSTHAPSSQNETTRSRRAEPAPAPTAYPTPTTARGGLAFHTAEALANPTPANLATLHAFVAPDATINGQPAPESADDFLAAAPDLLQAPAPVTSAKYAFAPTGDEPRPCIITLTHESGAVSRFTLNFIRATTEPHTGCWLIASLTGPNTS